MVPVNNSTGIEFLLITKNTFIEKKQYIKTFIGISSIQVHIHQLLEEEKWSDHYLNFHGAESALLMFGEDYLNYPLKQ